MTSPSTSVICEEVFDEGYQPSGDEINDYASKIGIDPVKEPHLLYLAKEGLIQALPADWKICYNDQLQAHYYINTRTKASQWDHPLDAVYRDLAEAARHKLTHDNSEDASQLDSGIRSLQGTDELDSNNTNDTSSPVSCNVKMNSVNGSTVSGFSGGVNKFLESRGKSFSSNSGFVGLKNSRFEVSKTNPQIGLAMRLGGAEKKEERKFSLTGTGSMFLKSNASSNNPVKVNALFADNLHANVKGILRDSSLTDMRRKAADDLDGEDKKSVRFNLDDIKMAANYSPEEDPSSSRKFTQSPDVSDNSDEENHWDLMDEEYQDKEIKVVAVPKPQPVTVLKPFVRSGSVVAPPDKMKDKNLVKPLYEDTDSDSRGSSVRSFIQKAEPQITEFDMQAQQDFYLGELKVKLEAERAAEEKRLREELAKDMEELKKEISKQNVAKVNEFKRKMEIRPEDMAEVDDEVTRDVDDYRRRKEEEKIRVLREENEIFKEEIEALKEEFAGKIEQIKLDYEEMLAKRRQELEDDNRRKLEEFAAKLEEEMAVKRKAIVDEHKGSMDTLQKNHSELLHELERDLKSEEEIVKKEHAVKLSDMRVKLSHELEVEKQRMRDSGEDRLYEKVRCEKRLLEDKYRCLKEKYVRLKTDVKMSLERRNRRREQAAAQQQSMTTGSETERSTSAKPMSIGNSEAKSFSDRPKPPVPPKSHLVEKEKYLREKSRESRKQGITSKYIKHLQVKYQDDTTSVSQSDTTISNNYPRGRYLPSPSPYSDNGNSDSDAFQRNMENNNNPKDRQRKKLFTRMKSASTSRLNTENYKERPCTPVENLRRQLEKLEDLEDQFPDNTLDATYHLRYPFSDISNDHPNNSSELEFFKHRIHLERDSVRRAKESLRSQRTNFRTRQREIKQRHKVPAPRHTLDQLIQEEKDLTEMEVNLHRTRALLGEKVIRLRHLEQSLQRIYEKEKPMDLLHVENKEDATLSDLSSHSSSGFSSTDFASGDTHNLARRKDMYQESSECIQNLEILNAEIREILDILGKPNPEKTTPTQQSSDLNWSNLLSISPPTFPLSPVTPTLVAPQTVQPIPTLADRLETYRQLAAGRVQTSVGGAMLAANTIVSQSPRAVNYTTSLVERTRDLRNWLRQAKNEHDVLTNFGAAIGNNPTGAPQQTNL